MAYVLSTMTWRTAAARISATTMNSRGIARGGLTRALLQGPGSIGWNRSFTTVPPLPCRVRLYGVPLSQPFRSVAWALLLLKVPFELVVTVPGQKDSSSSIVGARDPQFRQKTRARSITVPLLEILPPSLDTPEIDSTATTTATTTSTSHPQPEDPNTGLSSSSSSYGAITESGAILMHVCEQWDTSGVWYGRSGTLYKATIDSYCHWHHTNTRTLGRLASQYFLNAKSPTTTTVNPTEQEAMHKILHRLEHGWLSRTTTTSTEPILSDHTTVLDNKDVDDLFLAGGSHPSIADLLCYCEVVQVVWTGLVLHGPSNDNNNNIIQNHSNDTLQSLSQQYPRLGAWMQRMQQLPYHDPVHAALFHLGRIRPLPHNQTNDDNQVPWPKRLARANKAGIQALQEALQEQQDDKLGNSTTTTASTPRSKL